MRSLGTWNPAQTLPLCLSLQSLPVGKALGPAFEWGSGRANERLEEQRPFKRRCYTWAGRDVKKRQEDGGASEKLREKDGLGVESDFFSAFARWL